MARIMSAECVSITLFIHLLLMSTLFIYLHFEDGKRYLGSNNNSLSAFLQYWSRKTRTELVTESENDEMEFTHWSDGSANLASEGGEINPFPFDNYTGNDQQVIRKGTDNPTEQEGLGIEGMSLEEPAKDPVNSEEIIAEPFEESIIKPDEPVIDAENLHMGEEVPEDAPQPNENKEEFPNDNNNLPVDEAAPENVPDTTQEPEEIQKQEPPEKTEMAEEAPQSNENKEEFPNDNNNLPVDEAAPERVSDAPQEADEIQNQKPEEKTEMVQQSNNDAIDPNSFFQREITDIIAKNLGMPEQQGERTLPTLYEHYSDPTVVTGLTHNNSTFFLNNKEIRIMGGSIHYFRVHHEYWRSSLRKLRAAGLNTVTTYVPWNIHEQVRGHYWFSYVQHDLRRFIMMAKEEDLLVILRPGPYICAEWEFGGFPSWLLRDRSLQLRSLNSSFFLPAKKYLRQLVKLVSDLQWSATNGAQPIVAVQIENEFPISTQNAVEGKKYLKALKYSMEEDGMTNVLYIVTNPSKAVTTKSMIPGVLQAVNFGNLPYQRLKHLRIVQPHAPMFVMEFWTGWFDTWLRNHHTSDLLIFQEDFETLLRNDVSFNLYMFHGGSTFGFMNGAALKKDGESRAPIVSSYDFNAPLTESGDYTSKYYAIKKLIAVYGKGQPLHNPSMPPQTSKKAYPVGIVKQFLPFESIVQRLPIFITSENPVNMEDLNIYLGSGQRYGFILYRKTNVRIGQLSILKIHGLVRDALYVMIDGNHTVKPLTNRNHSESFLYLKDPEYLLSGDDGLHQLDLLVENMGRLSVGAMNNERKGILGQVYLDQQLLTNWTIYPLDFTQFFIQRLSNWRVFTPKERINSPGIYRAVLHVKDEQPSDTYLGLLSGEAFWLKGQIFVNNINLGRYWHLGPTKQAYIPAPLLHQGDNMIVIFELYQGARYVYFQDHASAR